MRATNKIIVTLIVGMVFFNSHASTTSYYQSTDPLFGEYAEYLNEKMVGPDDEVYKEYKKDEELYCWKLVMIESIDGTPIADSIKNELEKITMGYIDQYVVVNGCMISYCEPQNRSLNMMRNSNYSNCFADNYSELVDYFEKKYTELGIQVSFDNINVLSHLHKDEQTYIASWIDYFSICGFAFVGDNHHCCLVINKKYVLWFSKFNTLVTDYEMENIKSDTIDHFFEDPLPIYVGFQIDPTMRKIASDKTCYLYSETEDSLYMSIRYHVSKYDHLIIEKLGEKRFLGDWVSDYIYHVTVLPDYKGYHVIYVSCGEGYDDLHFGQLVVYSDLKEINKKSDRLNVECNYGCCEENERDGEAGCTHLFFDIYEDYTIRVRGRHVWDEEDKSITRYYRINDEGKFYELTNSAENDSPIACQSQLDTLDYGKEKENTNAKADENEEVRFPLYLLLGMAAVLLVFVVVFLKKKKK